MITISDYKKTYKTTTISLDNFTSTSRVTLILGANGSGKTTLLKSMAGLNHYQGTITQPHASYYIEENPSFPSSMRVKDYVAALQTLSHIPEKTCTYLIDFFHMRAHINKPFSDLSKGMKQKINLIQTFIMPSDMYLLDEPLNGLDELAKAQLLTFIKAAASSFIIATHNPGPFKPLSPRLIQL